MFRLNMLSVARFFFDRNIVSRMSVVSWINVCDLQADFAFFELVVMAHTAMAHNPFTTYSSVLLYLLLIKQWQITVQLVSYRSVASYDRQPSIVRHYGISQVNESEVTCTLQIHVSLQDMIFSYVTLHSRIHLLRMQINLKMP